MGISVEMTNNLASSAIVYCYCDSATPATTRVRTIKLFGPQQNVVLSATFIVPKNYYYLASTVSAGTTTFDLQDWAENDLY